MQPIIRWREVLALHRFSHSGGRRRRDFFSFFFLSPSRSCANTKLAAAAALRSACVVRSHFRACSPALFSPLVSRSARGKGRACQRRRLAPSARPTRCCAVRPRWPRRRPRRTPCRYGRRSTTTCGAWRGVCAALRGALTCWRRAARCARAQRARPGLRTRSARHRAPPPPPHPPRVLQE